VYGHGWIGAGPCAILAGAAGFPCPEISRPAALSNRGSFIRRQMDGSSCLRRAERAVARPWVRWTGTPGMSCPRCVPLDWIAIPSQVVTQQLRTRPYRRGLMRCQQVGPAGSSCREARQHLPDRCLAQHRSHSSIPRSGHHSCLV
jgi:hypothetical protein